MQVISMPAVAMIALVITAGMDDPRAMPAKRSTQWLCSEAFIRAQGTVKVKVAPVPSFAVAHKRP